MNRFQRPDAAGGGAACAALELFYDLVFVFAVTQVSTLLSRPHVVGSGAGVACPARRWWAWTYTTWVTNELDTESTPVRLVLLAIMFEPL